MKEKINNDFITTKLYLYQWIVSFALLILTSFGCHRVEATNYYVSNDGNDNANGRTESTAWKTIKKVNSHSYLPGDSILFRSGDTWFEELVINSSGNAVKNIVFGSYGKGERPRILGSVMINDWINVSGNIWKSKMKTDDPSVGAPHNGRSKANNKYPGGAWFEENDGKITWGHQEKEINRMGDLSLLTEEYDWGWYDGFIYIFSPTDPSDKYVSMQVSQRQSCIRIGFGKIQEYITIYGLEIMFAQSNGFYSGYPEYKASGLNFFNCHIGYIGIKGAAAAYGLSIHHSDMNIKNNVFNDCGRRGISYNMYKSTGLTFENIIIENNLFYNGYHTTSIDVSSMGHDTIKNFIFRNNIVLDDSTSLIEPPEDFSSNSIYIASSSSSSSYTNFYIYNNIIINSKARLLLVGKVDSLFVCNNTFYGLNKNAKPYSMITFSGNNKILFKNNIIYGNLPLKSFEAYCTLDERGTTNYIERDYNLYYQKDPGQIFTGTAGRYYLMSHWKTYQMTHGYDRNSPVPSDPEFAEPVLNFNISENSPARGAGGMIEWIKTDFYGNVMNFPPDLGAIQFGSNPLKEEDSIRNKIQNRK